MHKSITLRRVSAAIESDDCIGFCLECGEENIGVEPDAEDYECEFCGAECVMGAEQILMTMMP